ncbi:hypothetical protein M011DRAFT_425029 [Sporormia fimetaria CBS 119925]|uniref:Protein kinase domain-containing protein n=1 Tax=Sporormia fimetaria CBS 119925 TaxID=1340428 RepID=A0A6A6VB91_9PLEO|nr:hypothetical protein M011DRAFT_425029 [Sporormia fimetaria CBS 119925]
MIVLERLQYPLRKRLWDLRDAGAQPPTNDILRWALQISQALQRVHSRHVFQVDIGAHNILLDWNEDVKLSDFAGSSIDGSEPLIFPSSHSTHPDKSPKDPCIETEIFALGSTLYEIETTQKPHHDKDRIDIKDLLRAGEFPDASTLMLGEAILKCWRFEYQDCGEVVRDIMRIQHGHVNKMGRELEAAVPMETWRNSRALIPISLGLALVAATMTMYLRHTTLGLHRWGGY